jgi:hypothetical protein
MKVKRILVGVALAAGVAACGDAGSPLIPAAAGPSLDGGHTLGGGARAGDSSTTQTDTTQRGGHTLGGGA